MHEVNFLKIIGMVCLLMMIIREIGLSLNDMHSDEFLSFFSEA